MSDGPLQKFGAWLLGAGAGSFIASGILCRLIWGTWGKEGGAAMAFYFGIVLLVLGLLYTHADFD